MESTNSTESDSSTLSTEKTTNTECQVSSIIKDNMEPGSGRNQVLPSGSSKKERNATVNFDSPKPGQERKEKRKKSDQKWDAPKEVQENTDTNSTEFIRKSTNVMIAIYLFLLFFCILGSGCLSRILIHIMIWKINPPNRNITSMTTLFGNLVPDPDRSARNLSCSDISCNHGLPLHWECRAINSGDMCSLAEEIPTVNAAWFWAIMLTTSAPYVYSLLCNLSIWCTKHSEKINYKVFGIGFLKEVIHSIGFCIVVYFYLPTLTPDVAAITGLGLTLLPSIIHMVIRWSKIRTINRSHRSDVEENTTERIKKKKMFIAITYFLLSILGFLILAIYFTLFILSMDNLDWKISLYVTGIFCMSVDWFDAFLPTNVVCKNSSKHSEDSVKHGEDSMKHSPIQVREICLLSVIKLVLNFISILVVLAIQANSDMEALTILFSFDAVNTTVELNTLTGTVLLENTDALAFGCHYDSPFLTMVVSVISNFVFFKLSHHACRITYQSTLFSTPVCLVSTTVPVILSVMLLFSDSFIVDGCSVLQPLWMVNMTEWDSSNGFLVIAFSTGILSLLLINIHVWRKQKMDLLKARSLFAKMGYSGIFPDVSLLLSRNITDEKSKPKTDDVTSKSTTSTESSETNKSNMRPYIIACATMWHEDYKEMSQLLSSIFTLDSDISRNPEQYEFDFDANIFFDDAFCGEGKDRKLNKYTNDLYKAIQDTMKLCYQCEHDPPYPIKMDEPVKYETPYGLRYEWKLMGRKLTDSVPQDSRNTLTVHFKDKDKIRNKKRWSQVMYFYYNLSYSMNVEKDTVYCLDNVYILALDGDVKFKPDAVKHLLRGMERSKDKQVGACCGRIHPIGSGPMVWYQKFEYAASHWLQKSTEHVAGCVLCSPGCFTLVRGSAILDDNVMKTYANEADKAIEHIQYDQGEDRWLCTLLLKRGKRVEYCAAADAYTFAPEGFSEFFKQRRRWTPSTLANIYDIITDWRVADANNSSTKLFLLYQLFLFVTAIITPGTIFLLMYGAIIKAYDIRTWVAFLIVVIPVLFFIFTVFALSGKVQLKLAAVLSGVYGIIMMMVVIGVFKNGIESGWCSDTTIFIILVAGVFVVSALLHPQEFTCILPGILYIFCVPAMSMLLLIYAIGNINETSWGTREETTGKRNRSEQGASFSVGSLLKCICCPKSQIDPIDEKGNDFPRILRRTSEKQNLKVGDTLCLKVLVTGNPTPSLQWMKNGVLLKSSPIWTMRSISRSRYILKTTYLNLSDAGTYTCTAKNENGTTSMTWDVNVSGAEGNAATTPGFKRGLLHQTLYQGDKLTLKAYFSGCKSSDVHWNFKSIDGQICELKNDDPNSNCVIKMKDSESTLIKKNISNNDAGEYICRLPINTEQKTEVKATVNVLGEANQVEHSENHLDIENDLDNFEDKTLFVGQKLVMKIRITGFSTPPIVKWLRNGRRLPITEENLGRKTRIEVPNNEGMAISRNGTLYKWTIDKVKKSDSGRYKYEAYNVDGSTVKEKAATIIIKEKSENTSHDADLENVKSGFKDDDEDEFWYSIIDKYLSPDLSDKEALKRQQSIKSDLKHLRNKLFFGFLLINTMYVVLVYSMTEVNSNKELLHFRIYCPASSKVPYMDINPISVVFTLTFGVILVFQFFGMLYHRFSTFAQILVLSKSDAPLKKNKKPKSSERTNHSKSAFVNDEGCKECLKESVRTTESQIQTKQDSQKQKQNLNKSVFLISFMKGKFKEQLKNKQIKQ